MTNDKTMNVGNIIENIILPYEARIQSVSAIIETANQLFESCQDSFVEAKQEREKVNAELRESLAKNKSLRHKDFNCMMQDLYLTQDEEEKKVKNMLKSYFDEQKEMASTLRKSLENFKDSLARGENERIQDFQIFIKEIFAKQEERKQEIIAKLKQFQREQQEMAKKLRELLTRGRELRTKDLKAILNEFKAKKRERIARQEERRGEVNKMLGEFAKERTGEASPRLVAGEDKNQMDTQKDMIQKNAILHNSLADGVRL